MGHKRKEIFMEKYGIKTVGELKDFLEKLDPNMGLDLVANCYKGRNFCTIKKWYYSDEQNNGIEIDVYTNDEDNTLVINNSHSELFCLDED
jgi:hypothetical protein